MSLVNVNLNDPSVVESRPVPIGRYSLIVLSIEEATSKAGKPQLIATIGIEGHETAPNIRHYMSLPASGDEPKSSQYKTLLLKRFAGAFKAPFDDNGFDTDKWVGARATLGVGLDKPEGSNESYNRLDLPKLSDEGGPGGGRVAPPPPKS